MQEDLSERKRSGVNAAIRIINSQRLLLRSGSSSWGVLVHKFATMARTGIRWPFPSRFSATLNQRPGHDLRHGARLCLRTMPKYALPIATNLPASRSFASDKERRPILKSTRSRSGPRPDAESRRQTLEPGGSDPEADESFLDCSYLRKQSSRAYQSESHMAWLKHVSSTSKRQTDEYARARAKERWRRTQSILSRNNWVARYFRRAISTTSRGTCQRLHKQENGQFETLPGFSPTCGRAWELRSDAQLLLCLRLSAR